MRIEVSIVSKNRENEEATTEDRKIYVELQADDTGRKVAELIGIPSLMHMVTKRNIKIALEGMENPPTLTIDDERIDTPLAFPAESGIFDEIESVDEITRVLAETIKFAVKDIKLQSTEFDLEDVNLTLLDQGYVKMDDSFQPATVTVGTATYELRLIGEIPDPLKEQVDAIRAMYEAKLTRLSQQSQDGILALQHRINNIIKGQNVIPSWMSSELYKSPAFKNIGILPKNDRHNYYVVRFSFYGAAIKFVTSRGKWKKFLEPSPFPEVLHIMVKVSQDGKYGGGYAMDGMTGNQVNSFHFNGGGMCTGNVRMKALQSGKDLTTWYESVKKLLPTLNADSPFGGVNWEPHHQLHRELWEKKGHFDWSSKILEEDYFQFLGTKEEIPEQ